MRIVSLVPSFTKTLFDLGLDQEIVGFTKFCVEPFDKTQSIVKIGGTKNVDVEKVRSLNPDFVIANREENVKEQIQELEAFSKVILCDVVTLNDALKSIELFGNLFHKETEALILKNKIEHEFSQFHKPDKKLLACYLIWNNPIMSIGGDTFIHSMLEEAGFSNCIAEQNRYPTLRLDELKIMQPEVLMLSSEPFQFKEKHVVAYQKELPTTKVILVEGTYFSWYGSTIVDSPRYFNNLWAQILENR